MPTVAITDDFLDAMQTLPRKVQRKARSFLAKFRTDPRSKGINYEPVMADNSRVRTVRIGLDYRGIVLHPEKGDVYILAYVGHHDEAMAWARHKRFEIHPRTGALQVYTATQETEKKAKKPAKPPKGLFGKVTREEIFDLGVPDVLLPAVLAVQTEDQLDQLAPLLPAEAAEALYGLAAGLDYAEVLGEVERMLLQPDDLVTALQHPDTQRRVAVVDDDATLQAMLDAPWAKWRVFLHPTQRKLVSRHYNGPAKVTGGAGTGKTVVAVHRAVHLARHVFPKAQDRILFTTFTKNLAQAVGAQLALLDEGAAERIAARNLHSVAHEILRQSGLAVRVLGDEQVIADRWQDAKDDSGVECDREVQFLRDEYEQVVLAQGLQDEKEYMQAKRTGRRGRVSWQQRGPLWQVMMRFAALCEDAGELTYPMMVGRAADVLAENHRLPYRALVVDESQDFTPADWRLIRALVPAGENDIFLVGDAHQRIYGAPLVLSRYGIATRGRSRRLRVNYRTTQEIRRWACGILEGLSFDDLDGAQEKQDGYTSLLHGAVPELASCADLGQQIDVAAQRMAEWQEAGIADHAICCVAATRRECGKIAEGLRKKGIATLTLDKTVPPDGKKGVRIATRHRVKGLEFARVILFSVDLDAGAVDDDPRKRCLLYVAATRARDGLVVLGTWTSR